MSFGGANFGGSARVGGAVDGGKKSGSSNNPGSQAANKAKLGNMPAGVKTQGAGTVTTGRQAEQPSEGKIVSDPVSPNLNNPRTQNIMRSGDSYTGEDATPYIADPSLGQILGAMLTAAPMAGTMNNVMGVVNHLADGTSSFSSPSDGGAFGQMVDGFRGVKPGAVTGRSNPNQGGNPGRGTIQPMAAGYGRVEDADNQPDLGSTLTKILSAPGVWPPVRASAGV